MCCPGRIITAPVITEDRLSVLVGETGLVEVEYSGIMALSSYIGSATGVKYKFGRERTNGYVDQRDLNYFLNYLEYNVKVFNEKLD